MAGSSNIGGFTPVTVPQEHTTASVQNNPAPAASAPSLPSGGTPQETPAGRTRGTSIRKMLKHGDFKEGTKELKSRIKESSLMAKLRSGKVNEGGSNSSSSIRNTGEPSERPGQSSRLASLMSGQTGSDMLAMSDSRILDNVMRKTVEEAPSLAQRLANSMGLESQPLALFGAASPEEKAKAIGDQFKSNQKSIDNFTAAFSNLAAAADYQANYHKLMAPFLSKELGREDMKRGMIGIRFEANDGTTASEITSPAHLEMMGRHAAADLGGVRAQDIIGNRGAVHVVIWTKGPNDKDKESYDDPNGVPEYVDARGGSGTSNTMGLHGSSAQRGRYMMYESKNENFGDLMASVALAWSNKVKVKYDLSEYKKMDKTTPEFVEKSSDAEVRAVAYALSALLEDPLFGKNDPDSRKYIDEKIGSICSTLPEKDMQAVLLSLMANDSIMQDIEATKKGEVNENTDLKSRVKTYTEEIVNDGTLVNKNPRHPMPDGEGAKLDPRQADMAGLHLMNIREGALEGRHNAIAISPMLCEHFLNAESEDSPAKFKPSGVLVIERPIYEEKMYANPSLEESVNRRQDYEDGLEKAKSARNAADDSSGENHIQLAAKAEELENLVNDFTSPRSLIFLMRKSEHQANSAVATSLKKNPLLNDPEFKPMADAFEAQRQAVLKIQGDLGKLAKVSKDSPETITKNAELSKANTELTELRIKVLDQMDETRLKQKVDDEQLP